MKAGDEGREGTGKVFEGSVMLVGEGNRRSTGGAFVAPGRGTVVTVEVEGGERRGDAGTHGRDL